MILEKDLQLHNYLWTKGEAINFKAHYVKTRDTEGYCKSHKNALIVYFDYMQNIS